MPAWPVRLLYLKKRQIMSPSSLFFCSEPPHELLNCSLRSRCGHPCSLCRMVTDHLAQEAHACRVHTDRAG
jgi:hypothetical protein